MSCYIWYSEEGTGRRWSPPRPLLAVPNITVHPSTASIPVTLLLYNGPLLCGFSVPIKGLKSVAQLHVMSYTSLQRVKVIDGGLCVVRSWSNPFVFAYLLYCIQGRSRKGSGAYPQIWPRLQMFETCCDDDRISTFGARRHPLDIPRPGDYHRPSQHGLVPIFKKSTPCGSVRVTSGLIFQTPP